MQIGTDQGAIQSALDRSNIGYKILPCDFFANGNVFWKSSDWNMNHSKNTSSLLAEAMEHIHIVSLHANYIINSNLKKKCLKLSGLWYDKKIVSMNEGRVIESPQFRPRPINASLQNNVIINCQAIDDEKM